MVNYTFEPDVLRKFSSRIFQKFGISEADAEVISNVLIETEFRGINSHGIARILIYAQRIEKGLINPRPNFKVLRENATSALLDADNGMGHVISSKAMRLCIEKAKKTGMGTVGVRNSNHFGINAYYSMLASQENLIGMVFTNTSPLMAPFGGREPILGSNPLSIAIPAGVEPDLVVDMATSGAARGKLEVAAREGKKIPEGLAIDAEGRATIDPVEGLKGALLPFAGPKGYGMCLMVDTFAGVLTGSQFGHEVGSLFGNMDRPQNLGHFFLAFDVENFMPIDEFKQRMDQMIQNIRNSKVAAGFNRIYMPGEIEYEKSKKIRAQGITIDETVFRNLNELAQKLGVPEL
ncbi:MAG: Ldh family oxidoreductase [Clostridia bacterium]|nr:Ldh family oxidoreductase [Clostridia bacterium]